MKPARAYRAIAGGHCRRRRPGTGCGRPGRPPRPAPWRASRSQRLAPGGRDGWPGSAPRPRPPMLANHGKAPGIAVDGDLRVGQVAGEIFRRPGVIGPEGGRHGWRPAPCGVTAGSPAPDRGAGRHRRGGHRAWAGATSVSRPQHSRHSAQRTSLRPIILDPGGGRPRRRTHRRSGRRGGRGRAIGHRQTQGRGRVGRVDQPGREQSEFCTWAEGVAHRAWLAWVVRQARPDLGRVGRQGRGLG